MHFLITGGSSFLGSHILKRAIRESDLQIAATYFRHAIREANVAAFCVDMRDAKAVQEVVAETQPDVIIHTPAVMEGRLLDTLNVDGSRHIAIAAKEAHARLIYISSDVIFDGEHAPYAENARPQPMTPYARSKAAAERAVHDLIPEVVIIRTSVIYSLTPMDPRTRDILAGKIPHLFSDEYRCPIFVNDLADGLIELAWTDFRGTLNVAGPQKLSRYEFGLKLARAFGVEPKFEPALSASHATPRPRDCALDTLLATKTLKTKLKGVDEIIREYEQRNE